MEQNNHKSVRLTVGQAIVKYLQVQYSERDGIRQRLIPNMFGIFGHGNVAGLGQALDEYGDDIPYMQTRNEQSMVHIATGYAKWKRRRSTLACTASIGPGTTNLVTGAATATANHLPVLLFPSDHYATRFQGPVLQQIEHPVSFDIGAVDTLRPVSRFFDRISRPEQLISALPMAMRVLTNPVETGAVTIALPQDVQMMAFDYPEHLFEERTWHIERPYPNPDAIATAINLIEKAAKPVVLAGGGVLYSEAESEIATFAKANGIPVGETHAGKGAGRFADAMSIGGMGVGGTSASAGLAEEADLVIGIGTRFTDFATGSQSAFKNPNVQFISINVTAQDAYKQGAHPVVADAKIALEQITEGLTDYSVSDAWRQRITSLKAEWEVTLTNTFAPSGAGPMRQPELIKIVNDFAQSGDVSVAAAGSLPGDMRQLWDCENNRHCMLEFGYSCMTWEIPAGIGAKMADPDREVFVMIGDGTYLMNPSEIVTAVQEGIKIIIVLSHNHGFQVIRHLQEGTTGSSFGNEFRMRAEGSNRLTGDYLTIDYAKNAASMGAVGLHAKTPEELRQALREARNIIRRPVLIDVDIYPGITNPDTGVWWDVAAAEVSEKAEVQEIRSNYIQGQKSQRTYY
jgi:3D-(3,5/4)-trihydroxycyclohexane-1,2-dione acylhydrolase (decyclizing)